MNTLLARAGAAAGRDRRRRRLGARAQARDRRRRAAPAAVGGEDRPRSRAARSAASRCAGCCCRRPTCCCSMSRPIISTPSRSPGSSAISRNIRARSIAVTHDRYFLDNVAEWILELDRGHGIPWHGNYSSWLEQKEQRLALEEREREALRKTLEHELEWVRQNPQGTPGQEQGAPAALRGARLARVPGAQRDQRDLHSRRASVSAIW